ncbi:MAG: hypothetical protein ABIK61_00010 [candidate division WOR-3 bacterium]
MKSWIFNLRVMEFGLSVAVTYFRAMSETDNKYYNNFNNINICHTGQEEATVK